MFQHSSPHLTSSLLVSIPSHILLCFSWASYVDLIILYKSYVCPEILEMLKFPQSGRRVGHVGLTSGSFTAAEFMELCR